MIVHGTGKAYYADVKNKKMIERHKDGLKLKPADVVECFVVEEESDVTMLQSRVRAEQ